MFITKTKRVISSSIKNIVRNMWLSVATVIIIVIALFTMATMFAVDTLGNHAIASLKEKIDISVQFREDADEDKILELKEDLEDLKEVKTVEYISKEQALINFKEAHKDNAYINESIEELGENPLFAVLNIKANSLEQYKSINDYLLSNDNYKDIIEKVNFKENEKSIDNFSNVLKTIKEGIFGLTVLFVFIGVLVAFNTIRLAMYAHKIEIEIMRLVGADNWYIRMPFIAEGAIFGIVGGAVTIAVIFPTAAYISPKIEKFLPTFNLYAHFTNNFTAIATLLFAAGVALGVISSFIAIRRYLKI